MHSVRRSVRRPNILPARPWAAAKRAALALVRYSTPWLAQLVVTRRCNLACGYCNEYDHSSDPVPTEELLRRIDHLAELGTVVVTLTGGEPLLHPELDRLVARVVSHGMVCTSITNAYPITPRWIARLNEARLTLLQVSVDNVEPNDVSQKSWSKIRRRLDLLRQHAEFPVNVNAVLGSCTPSQTRMLAQEVHELGFYMTVGLMHDGRGQVDPGLLGEELPQLYKELQALCHKSIFHWLGEGWETRMLREGSVQWRCRAGGRYLYVDEHGVVSYCSQRRNDPGIQLRSYGREDLERGFHMIKGCEDSCTLACVRRASSLDEWRGQRGVDLVPQGSLVSPTQAAPGVRVQLPVLGG